MREIFTKWSYDGRKLARPDVIVWRLIWFLPFKAALLLTCLLAFFGFGLTAAQAIWAAGR